MTAQSKFSLFLFIQQTNFGTMRSIYHILGMETPGYIPILYESIPKYPQVSLFCMKVSPSIPDIPKYPQICMKYPLYPGVSMPSQNPYLFRKFLLGFFGKKIRKPPKIFLWDFEKFL